MKKVALSLAVIATLALVSCGNKAKQADTDTPVDTPAVEQVVDTPTDTPTDSPKVEENTDKATADATAPTQEENKTPEAK